MQTRQWQARTVVRKCVSLGWWLVAAGAAAALGLDPDDVTSPER